MKMTLQIEKDEFWIIRQALMNMQFKQNEISINLQCKADESALRILNKLEKQVAKSDS